MLLNPDAGLTKEQIVDKAVSNLTPETKAWSLAYAESLGMTIYELMEMLVADYREEARKNPGAHGAKLDFTAFPFGHA